MDAVFGANCNPEMTRLFEEQSRESDIKKRLQLVWQIDRKLQQDVAQPIIMNGLASTCSQPHVKYPTVQSNRTYNGWRFENVWLDR
jgi:peptide/nickel transport system substrate-binding protein